MKNVKNEKRENNLMQEDSVCTLGGVLCEFISQRPKVVVGNVINGQNIRVIGTKAFKNSKIKHVTISEGIEEIEDYAFYKTDISTIVLPSTIKKIGLNAFSCMGRNFNIVLNLSLPQNEWQQLKKSSIELENDAYILSSKRTNNKTLNCVLEFMELKYGLVSHIPDFVSVLFSKTGNVHDLYLKNNKIETEIGMVKHLIKNELLYEVSKEIDENDDLMFRKGYNHTHLSGFDLDRLTVTVCKFHAEPHFRTDKTVNVKFRFIRDCLFWSRIEKVVYDNKNYYVYSREILRSDDKFPYEKHVSRVFDAFGNNIDENLEELVRRKYNLIRSLSG